MRFSLSLPPLAVLLLLAFLWLILAVLVFWFVFRPRRGAAEPEQEERKPRSGGRQSNATTVVKPGSPTRTSTSPGQPRAPTVRAVTPPKDDPESDAFDEFNRPGQRRDDFDF